MLKSMWMKWHHKFAYGAEKEEHWVDLGACKSMEDAKRNAKEECMELAREYEWSEHYRGIDYEIVELPPVEVLEKLEKKYLVQSEGFKRRAAELRRLIEEAKRT